MSPDLLTLPQGGAVPNSALPARLYRAAFVGRSPGQIEVALAGRGWTGAWRNGIYPFQH